MLECSLQNGETRDRFHLLEPILIMFTLDVSFVFPKDALYDSDDTVHTLCCWNLVDASNPGTFYFASLRRSQCAQ